MRHLGDIAASIAGGAPGKKDLHGTGSAYVDAGSAQMAELADAVDSKSTDASLVGSTPTLGTMPTSFKLHLDDGVSALLAGA